MLIPGPPIPPLPIKTLLKALAAVTVIQAALKFAKEKMQKGQK